MSKIAKKLIADGAVTFEFSDHETVTVRVDSLPDDIKTKLIVHGLSQKLGDSYAGAMSLKEAKEKFHATRENLLAGSWSSGRASSGGDLLAALMKATGQDEEACRTILDDMDKEKKAELRKHPAVAAQLAQMKAEREAAKAEKLLAGGGTTLDLSSIGV